MRWRVTFYQILALFAVAGLVMVAPCLNASTCSVGPHSHCPLDAAATKTGKSPHAVQCSLVATKEGARSQVLWTPVSTGPERHPVPIENTDLLQGVVRPTLAGILVIPRKGPVRRSPELPSAYQRRAPPMV